MYNKEVRHPNDTILMTCIYAAFSSFLFPIGKIQSDKKNKDAHYHLPLNNFY
jgi:hypothetical protein